MDGAKSVMVPIKVHFKLSVEMCPSSDEENEEMIWVSYANAIGSVMYLMVCTRPDLAYAVSITSRYMKNPGKGH